MRYVLRLEFDYVFAKFWYPNMLRLVCEKYLGEARFEFLLWTIPWYFIVLSLFDVFIVH